MFVKHHNKIIVILKINNNANFTLYDNTPHEGRSVWLVSVTYLTLTGAAL